MNTVPHEAKAAVSEDKERVIFLVVASLFWCPVIAGVCAFWFRESGCQLIDNAPISVIWEEWTWKSAFFHYLWRCGVVAAAFGCLISIKNWKSSRPYITAVTLLMALVLFIYAPFNKTHPYITLAKEGIWVKDSTAQIKWENIQEITLLLTQEFKMVSDGKQPCGGNCKLQIKCGIEPPLETEVLNIIVDPESSKIAWTKAIKAFAPNAKLKYQEHSIWHYRFDKREETQFRQLW